MQHAAYDASSTRALVSGTAISGAGGSLSSPLRGSAVGGEADEPAGGPRLTDGIGDAIGARSWSGTSMTAGMLPSLSGRWGSVLSKAVTSAGDPQARLGFMCV